MKLDLSRRFTQNEKCSSSANGKPPTQRQSLTVYNLPIELIDQIVGALSDSDFFALRLVCRDLVRLTYPAFGRKWFSSLDTSLTEADLGRLWRISAHEQLRMAVRKLRINISCTPDTRPPKARLWALAIDFFQRAKGDLIIGRSSSSRGLTSTQNPVDSPDLSVNPTLHSIEAGRLMNCTEIQLEYEGDRGNNEDVPGTRVLHPEALQFMLSSVEHGLPVRSFVARLRKTRFIEHPSQQPVRKILASERFQSSWTSCLEDLSLDWDAPNMIDILPVTQLVTMAQNLRTLRLLGPIPTYSLVTLAENTRLPQVRELTMGIFIWTIPHDSLVQLIVGMGSRLEALSLLAPKVDGDASAWPTVIRGLTKLPKLRKITLFALRQNTTPGKDIIYFCPLLARPEAQEDMGFDILPETLPSRNRVFGVRYHGEGEAMHKALDILADSVCFESWDGNIDAYLDPRGEYSDVWRWRRFSFYRGFA
ncbi:hypothetical protein DM02DRAFT_662948 [Periconia macrospinosa]|uniref:F-box domain-containing protein n=1 Tax=Periconia macrospinosa TaxID=97972 RepID=A0A2V1D5B5_9PLEO|nr:hypothetical protein DM02DRAFT_662948 [Periconia macrospinosa]